MSTLTNAARPELDLLANRRAVETCLEGFLVGKQRAAAEHCMPAEVVQTLRNFVFAGGKRLRPLLCICGWYAGGGAGDMAAVVQAAASLEMFHAFALIHDDLMDHSDTRRGKPTVHRSLAAHHSALRGQEAASHLGTGGAILVGDLALAWSDELLHTAGLTPDRLAAVLPVIDGMRTEVMYGQYLDLCAAGDPTLDLDAALTVARYKTAKYTCERPLHIGASLAGAGLAVLEACTAYALPLGEAFQLRDDLLGVYGAPEQTGKPVLDDLRGAKHTVLLALALQRADAAQRKVLHLLLGNPGLDEHDAVRIRGILTATGARAEVERLIRNRHAQAHQALDQASFPPSTARTLRRIADAATVRAA
ncbi:polyprenyl synthetase family protein [Streptomyces clavuligerus]|nr:polyprenyl synthetase family protein [Streptomyces clavuligerus]ANW16759.1 geranylgeranyl diphosphate synthase [Streptomyces clavuligerus]AXU11286.1 polyprenyl synthetase family protein [Streptomyces clavuligerus]EDY51665.1 geranylgeranyl diphosphate synthase [Streptomyces clavuligerus]MBY6301092.1 polyprenyl synthetase family protein [Streptomyces clavuligerus]QCS04154.1 polyprenyl synthetase family protein [Streptomyces clavuligerus]